MFSVKGRNGTRGGGWLARYEYADAKEASFQSEEGVRIRAQLLLPKPEFSHAPLLIYVKRAQDSFYSSDHYCPVKNPGK